MSVVAPYATSPDQTRPVPLRLLPGVAVATAVGLVALGIAGIEERAFGHPIVEGLVVAILLGMILRTLWTPSARMDAGIGFTAKEILEVAVLLLGASVDLPLLLRAGPALAVGIVLLVVLGIAFSYGIGRLMGLPHKLSVLVACGNAICGNAGFGRCDDRQRRAGHPRGQGACRVVDCVHRHPWSGGRDRAPVPDPAA